MLDTKNCRNRVAFIFNRGPHGDSTGREGLDSLLAMSLFHKEIGVFFISDGILLLISNQKPDKILAKDFISTFSALPLYNICKLYLCKDSAIDRGINDSIDFLLPIERLSSKIWKERLNNYNIILSF